MAAWTTRRHVPESRDTSLSGSADWPGALAGAAALAAITYAILVLPGAGVTSPEFAVAAVLALVSSAAFAVTERRGSHPMLPPAIFAPAQFRAANAVTFVVNGALGGFAFVFIPALEIIAGYSPVVAGSALVPVTVVTLLLSGASGRLAQRIGPRPQLVAGSIQLSPHAHRVNAPGRRRLGRHGSEHAQRSAEAVRELVGKRRLTERPGATLCVGRAHWEAPRWSSPETR